MLIAIDTETTGVDFYHGARPYLVTVCEHQHDPYFWEWEVDPLTREIMVDPDDVKEIVEVLASADEIVTHNGKFDVTALTTVLPEGYEWPWHKTYDTLLASHLLESLLPHNLTDVCLRWLHEDISKLEENLKKACMEARNFCRHKLPKWKIAKQGMPEMPSIRSSTTSKEKGGQDERPWKNDGWLPKTLCRNSLLFSQKDHPWHTVLRDYACADSAVTVCLWPLMKHELVDRELYDLYLEDRLPLMRIAYDMERRGVTVSIEELLKMKERYQCELYDLNHRCMSIAESYDYELQLPKGGSRNHSLDRFIFEVMDVPVVEMTDSGQKPALDKEVLKHYTVTLPPNSRELVFMNSMVKMRAKEKALQSIESYEKFGVNDNEHPGFLILHPNLNPTGTSTPRWSCTNPNEQNISKQADEEGMSLRDCFCPEPGRELWSFDAKNIELRIPFYVSNEASLIELFERPDDPPYYGSNHLANFHAVYPDIWEAAVKEVGYDKAGPYCKKKYASTWYQWCKNGGFAKQYGGQRAKVDATFRKKGAFDLLDSKFGKLAELNRQCIKHAEEFGYVETLPNKRLGRRRGYPLMCTRTEYGKILPTVPLSYFVQGSAMEWTNRGMIRVVEQLSKWRNEGFDAYLMLQVHDEIVPNFPAAADPAEDLEREKKTGKTKSGAQKPYFRTSNLWRARVIQRLLEEGGKDIGIPTPVGMEYHDRSWGRGFTVN